MTETQKTKVSISIGDPHGIGIEIILKAFEDKRMFDFFTPLVFAPIKRIQHYKKTLQIDTGIFVTNLEKLHKKQLNVVSLHDQDHPIAFGTPSSESGGIALASLEAATEALKKEQADILVTAPIDKHAIQSDTFRFLGHTGYLAEQLEGESLMLMVSENLRVALLSDHIPVKEISSILTEERLTQTIQLLMQSLQFDFGIPKPKIAVLGLNPHTGDNGLIGKEDADIIAPTVEKYLKKGQLVYGPYAADGFFGSGTYQQFDAVLAMYHDQGLIPFKTLSFGEGVNFTAGLNRIRTSPDHGTAFDIAGKGIANPDSFKEALFTGRKIFQTRKMEKMLNQDHSNEDTP